MAEYWAVKAGRKAGVFYAEWAEVEPLVRNFPGKSFKACTTLVEAQEFLSSDSHVPSIPLEGAGYLQGAKHAVILEFDGVSCGELGPAGCSAVLRLSDTGIVVLEVGQKLPRGLSANEAEYHGLLLGLKEAAHLGARHVQACGDSQLVVKQMRKEWLVCQPSLMKLWRQATDAALDFTTFSIQHTCRSSNIRADELATEVVENGPFRQLYLTTPMPCSVMRSSGRRRRRSQMASPLEGGFWGASFFMRGSSWGRRRASASELEAGPAMMSVSAFM